MKRRTLLRTAGIAAGGLAGISGCAAQDDGSEGVPDDAEPRIVSDTATPTPTETPSGTQAGTGAPAGGGGDVIATSYEFLGVVEGWQGQAPPFIADQVNPTLNLEPGRKYEVTWTNGDGIPHDFTIQDAQGNELAATELVTEEGASATLTFTASEQMAQYLCTVHPTTMVGDIEFQS